MQHPGHSGCARLLGEQRILHVISQSVSRVVWLGRVLVPV